MTINNSILAFKQGFNGGTRANRFVVEPSWPANLGIQVPSGEATFKMVSASLPGSVVNGISIPWRGRAYNIPGDRSYTPWTVGVYDDNNFNNTWAAIQKWSENMDGHFTHKVVNNDFSFASLQTTWRIRQLSINGNQTIRRITLYKCWPSVIDEIPLNMAEASFVAYPITLTFDYMQIEDADVMIRNNQ